MMRRILLLIALITALALPAQAVAKDIVPSASGAHQYHRFIPDVDGAEPEPAQPIEPQSTLPFTGEDVLLVVLAGALLTGGGIVLYRQAKHR